MSLAVQPTLLICDIPASVSAHGNKRMPDMFGPFDGKFLEDTKENIASVSTGALQVSIKELDISQLPHNKQYEDHSYSTTNHPVTGLGFHYCAFDRFFHHQRRPKSDCLHALDIVPECASINSQVVDELFTSLDDGRHILTRMSPTQHIFAIRLLCLLRNNILNKKSVALNRALDEPSSLSVVPGTDERVIVCEEARGELYAVHNVCTEVICCKKNVYRGYMLCTEVICCTQAMYRGYMLYTGCIQRLYAVCTEFICCTHPGYMLYTGCVQRLYAVHRVCTYFPKNCSMSWKSLKNGIISSR